MKRMKLIFLSVFLVCGILSGCQKSTTEQGIESDIKELQNDSKELKEENEKLKKELEELEKQKAEEKAQKTASESKEAASGKNELAGAQTAETAKADDADSSTPPKAENSMVPCPDCEGTGFFNQCGKCDGTGFDSYNNQECDMCNGSGKHVCNLCQGEGMIAASAVPSAPAVDNSASSDASGTAGYTPDYSRTPVTPYIPDNSKKPCGYCGGDGKNKCPFCDGEGYRTEYKSVPTYGSGGSSGYEARVRCRHCKGSGQEKCLYCGGEGSY